MSRINPNTLFIGQQQKFLPSCQSTNDIMSQLLQEGNLLEGQLVWTLHQTAGRGQRGNSWEAAAGQNLTFSILLKPSFLKASEQFALSTATALALKKGLDSFLPQSSPILLKWPNDLFVGDKKLGGILIENQLRKSHLEAAVVGVGINVNQRGFEHDRATSLSIITQQEHELPAVLEKILHCLEQYYLMLKARQYTVLRKQYHQALYASGKWGVYEDLRGNTPKMFNGKIRGVDLLGRLCIEKQSGDIDAFAMKEVKMVY